MEICEDAWTRISDVIFSLSRALATQVFCCFSSGSGCYSHTALFSSGIYPVISTLGPLYYPIPLFVMLLSLIVTHLAFSYFSGLFLSITSSKKPFLTSQHKVAPTSHSSLLKCDPHSFSCLLFPFLFMCCFSEIWKRSILGN